MLMVTEFKNSDRVWQYYLSTSVLKEVDSDDLQPHLDEARISEIEATICVQNGFCSECRYMLDNWPATVDRSKHPPHTLRECDTHSIEAAARRGCEFCALVLQFLLDQSMLRLHRQIEWRLRTLKARDVSSLTICTNLPTNECKVRMEMPGLIESLWASQEDGINVNIRGRVSATEPDCGM
jgi:hypothetical protein